MFNFTATVAFIGEVFGDGIVFVSALVPKMFPNVASREMAVFGNAHLVT